MLIISFLDSEHIGRLPTQIKTQEEMMSHFSLPEYCASSGLQVYFYTYYLVDSMELSSWIVPLSSIATSATRKIGNRINWLPTEVRFNRILSLPRSDPVQEAVTLHVRQIRSEKSTHILCCSQWRKVAQKQDFHRFQTQLELGLSSSD
jgi:hypothetical protein